MRNIVRFRWQKAGGTSAADLLRECGEKLTDRALWTQFQERFQGLIFTYLMRALRLARFLMVHICVLSGPAESKRAAAAAAC